MLFHSGLEVRSGWAGDAESGLALSAIEDTSRTAIRVSKRPYLGALHSGPRPEADGTGDAESGLALSAIGDTSQTAIWVSKQPYLIAVAEGALSQRSSNPNKDERMTFRADFALSAIEEAQPGSRSLTCMWRGLFAAESPRTAGLWLPPNALAIHGSGAVLS